MAVPRPSQAGVSTAPATYHARYSGSLQPNAPANASEPDPIPNRTMPIAQASWKARRRARAWSNRAIAKRKARSAVTPASQGPGISGLPRRGARPASGEDGRGADRRPPAIARDQVHQEPVEQRR